MTMPAAVSDQPLPADAAPGRPELILKSSEFRKGREEGWRELEDLIKRVERGGVRKLSLDELQRLPILYRAALSSLSVARTIALDRNLLLYLEGLSVRAYLAVYGPRANALEGLRNFFGRELPAAVRVRALAHPDCGALRCSSAPSRASCWSCRTRAGSTHSCRRAWPVGAALPSTRAELLDKEIFAPWPGAVESFGLFAGVLFNHNTLVGILTFGLGMAAGIPTMLLTVYQGLPSGPSSRCTTTATSLSTSSAGSRSMASPKSAGSCCSRPAAW